MSDLTKADQASYDMAKLIVDSRFEFDNRPTEDGDYQHLCTYCDGAWDEGKDEEHFSGCPVPIAREVLRLHEVEQGKKAALSLADAFRQEHMRERERADKAEAALAAYEARWGRLEDLAKMVEEAVDKRPLSEIVAEAEERGADRARRHISAYFLVAAHDVTTNSGDADYVESFSRERCIAIVEGPHAE